MGYGCGSDEDGGTAADNRGDGVYNINQPAIPTGLTITEITSGVITNTNDLFNGSWAHLTVSICNSTASDINFTVDSGFVFIPASTSAQSMTIIQTKIITVIPGCNVYVIPVYCLNSDLAAPSIEYQYQLQGIVYRPCLLQIMTILQGKDLTIASTPYSTLFPQFMQIQNIIWSCIQTGTLTSADISFLEGLPDI
ncbi:MAG: hypothetical protein KAS64_04880 [Spirochaetes bacterium]|nr:hypothetical protein [Spirochaetota bacterium]